MDCHFARSTVITSLNIFALKTSFTCAVKHDLQLGCSGATCRYICTALVSSVLQWLIPCLKYVPPFNLPTLPSWLCAISIIT